MEQINVNRISKCQGSTAGLPGKMQHQGKSPVAKYWLTPTIRIKILNSKDAVPLIIVDDKISFSSSVGKCDCQISTFRDENQDKTLTRNTKGRNILSERPNYSESNTINYSKCIIVIESNIDNCLEKPKTKCELRHNNLNDWKDFLKQEVSKRTKNPRKNIY